MIGVHNGDGRGWRWESTGESRNAGQGGACDLRGIWREREGDGGMLMLMLMLM